MNKKKTVVKTRNAGTMTESAFWSFIRSALRQKSRWWKPIAKAKESARRKHIVPKGSKSKQRWEYQCAACQNWFAEKGVNVDHKVPAGSLKSAADLPGFVERLFCEVDNLQVLCSKCHDQKTEYEKKVSRIGSHEHLLKKNKAKSKH
jgi:5-methylcytosine-specific restriction endonuclease McrA